MEQHETETRELRRLIRDLVALATTPAVWVGREPIHIADGIADILLHTLRAQAVYVALQRGSAVEGIRNAGYNGFKDQVLSLRAESASNTMMVETVGLPEWPSTLRVAIHPIGLLGDDDAFVAVGCSRTDFPNEAESLLLSMAANQAAVGLQTARLRMKAEFERRQIEELLSQAPAAIGMFTGPDHRWVYVNESYVRVTGRKSASDFLGKTLRESLPEIDTQPFIVELVDGVYRSGQPYVGHEMNVRLNRGHTGQSEEAYFDFVYQPVHNDEGGIDGVLVHAVEVTERVLSRRKIEESEQRLRAMIETTPECVKVVAPDGTLLQMNAAGLSMVGAECPEAALGKNIYDVIAPEDRDRFRAFNESVCRGTRGILEFDIVGLKGVRRHMETHAAPLRAKDGSVVQLAVTRDVTERKRAAAALRQSEEQFRALANAMPQLVWIADPDGSIFWYNQRWYDYTGTTPESMLGWGWQSVHDPAVLPSVMNRWKKCIAEGTVFEMTFPLRSGSGEFRPFLTRVVPIRDLEGRISRWFGTNTDVSVEVAVQEELRRNQARLETALVASQRLAAIVESSDDAIVSKDLNGIVTSWNPAAERIFGYTAAEMIGQSITKIIPPELYQDEDRILSTIARGDRIEQFETVRVTKNDERVDVSLTVSPVRDEAGRIVGAAKIARNITQQKKAERALHMAERLASVGRLAATVAHEINNPLEAVMNFIFLAQRAEGLPQNARTYLALADEQLGRVSHIAQQTLGFYRDTSSPMLVNICEPLDDVLRVFENKLHYKSLVVDRSRFTELWIETLGGELRQILSNLISNAIDASTKNGVIRVRARVLSKEGGKFAHITVADQGTGISPEAKEVIFTPFFTTKRDVGTGLGLWATKGMIEKQGGRIAFRSKIGKGTVFTVDFPFRVSEVNSASVPTVTQFVAQESK